MGALRAARARIVANQRVKLQLPVPTHALRAIRRARSHGKSTRVDVGISVSNRPGNKYASMYFSARVQLRALAQRRPIRARPS